MLPTAFKSTVTLILSAKKFILLEVRYWGQREYSPLFRRGCVSSSQNFEGGEVRVVASLKSPNPK